MSPTVKCLSRKFLSSGAILGIFLGIFFLCPPPVGASVPEYDLARMRQVNPDFSTYPDARGIVWLKRVSCGPARDGGMERTHLWVLLGRSGLDRRWLDWDIPDPPGGSARVLEAGVYALESSRKIADILPSERDQGGVTMHSVRFEELPETFILVLCWQDSFPGSLSLEDLVWTQESLPVWESVVEVSVPDGRPFFHYSFQNHRSFQNVRPEVERGNGRSVYTWRTVNAEPLVPGELRASIRGGVVFGMRQGTEGLARLMRDEAAAAVPQAPPAALGGFHRGTEAGTAALLSWLYEQPDAVLPEGCRRALPSEGPWTGGEKLLMAHAWLRERGVNALLHWRTALGPDANSPVCPGLLLAPVLEVPPFKGARFKESFFCDLDDAPRMGRTSPLLMGCRIFAPDGEGRVAGRRIPEAKASENRLRALLDLSLSPGGALSGTVRLQARGAWRSLFFRAWEDGRAGELLPSLFRNLRGYEAAQLKESGGEAELAFRIGEMPGIMGTQGKNLLVILPAFVPESLQSLPGESIPVELAFPFLLEQRVSLLLPPGVKRVMLPTDTERASGKVLYGESFKASRLKKVMAEARLQVSATRLAEEDGASLRTALDLWRNFSARPLPLLMRGKE